MRDCIVDNPKMNDSRSMSSFSFVEEDFLTEIMSSFIFGFSKIERISDNGASEWLSERKRSCIASQKIW